jgi:glycerol-3-phosphate acyltransferase PlsY
MTAALAYLVGCINPTYILARLKGFDIREKGSRNAGASNALINFGKTVGILFAVFDILKATAMTFLAAVILPSVPYAMPLGGVFCILGHVFPFYMGFRGGKGTACLSGMILALDFRMFLIMLAGEIVLVLVTDYLCFLPISLSVILPIVYCVLKHDVIGTLILCLSSAVILIKNVENITRIKHGTEMRLSYLWKKDGELERITKATERNRKK